jgi:hypothetical protein
MREAYKRSVLEKSMMASGFVCIMDALGTKGIWHQYVAEDYINKLKSMRRSFEQHYINQIPEVKAERLKFQLFSDTVIVTYDYSSFQNKSNIDPLLLMTYFSRLIVKPFYDCLEQGLFLRGAISHGKFYTDKNIVVGPAIDDAYEYYEKAKWIGVSCTPSASHSAKYAVALAKKLEKETPNYFIECEVPVQGRSRIKLMAIDWPRYFSEKMPRTESKLDASLEIRRLLASNPFPAVALDIYDNTFAFCDNRFDKIGQAEKDDGLEAKTGRKSE